MPSLKEIKERIASVNSTLKITSAMKMVASAKLRKAQTAIGNMVPYQQRLNRILVDLMNSPEKAPGKSSLTPVEEGDISSFAVNRDVRSVALVCFSSNSSLCGGFNANAIREATKVVKEYAAAGVNVTVYSVGKKMADAMRKLGYPSPADYTKMSANPSYEAAAALGQELRDSFLSGKYDKVELIYNHFKSTSSQPTVRDTYIPLTLGSAAAELASSKGAKKEGAKPREIDFIVEPDRDTQISLLFPKVMLLKVYTVLLDTVAAEHAARTVAMQTATDNGNELLSELTLEYNKGRQQKITTDLLDMESGSSE